MPVFEYTATYPYPRHEVFAWHERPGAFVRLTPPGSMIPMAGPTDGIRTGSLLTLRLSLPFLSAWWPFGTAPGAPWVAEHTAYEPDVLFVDEQRSGPMAQWRHEHHFADAPDGGTTITDRVTYRLPTGLQVADSLVQQHLAGLFRFREDQLRGDLALHARLADTPQTVAISGASGMIGTQLGALLSTGGHTVRRLVRRAPRHTDEIGWRPDRGELDPAALTGVDTVVNLAGRNIGGRFIEQAKREILASRLDSTTTLVRAIEAARAAGEGPAALVQASGIGLYGARRPGEVLDEDSRPGDDFLAEVVRQWEAAAAPVEAIGVRLVTLRTGIVLDAAEGALAKQLPLFLVGAGGRLTRPQAMMSWISLDDLARLYATAVLDPSWRGPVNAVAPAPVSSGAFATRLGRVMRRPSLVPTPGFGPRLLLGRQGADELVHTDQWVSGARAEQLGFRFTHPELETALRHALAQ